MPKVSKDARATAAVPPISSSNLKSRASPPTRRVANKSARTQFSACGACRMRRVKCDLKDIQGKSGQPLPCTNCQERGFRCIDEFADAKVAKLHRRGRGIQRVESVYGLQGQEFIPINAYGHQFISHSKIPKLKPTFLSSRFFRIFQVLHPLIDPTEVSSRLSDFAEGNDDALEMPGKILAMVLMAWATSFGVDETGQEDTHHGVASVRYRQRQTNEMVAELLLLIDTHGILRKPTWDGVRALLLLLPLSEDLQTPLERMTFHEAAINQVYALCSFTPISSIADGYENILDTPIRARIYWYAHTLESMATGLRGGRLLLADEDLITFQDTLPPLNPPTPAVGMQLALQLAYHHHAVPLRLAAVCRHIHRVLTGPKALAHHNLDEPRLRAIWESLETIWTEFDSLREPNGAGFLCEDDLESFIHSWQIFLFESHSIIREALKQRLRTLQSSSVQVASDASTALRELRLEQVERMHDLAEIKCRELGEKVLSFIRQHLKTNFFAFSACLIRDGCFFAGLLFAERDGGTEERIQTCFAALREMRWAHCKSDEREQTLMMVYQARLGAQRQVVCSEATAVRLPSPTPPTPQSAVNFHRSEVFRHLPPLDLGDSLSPVESAPSTATTDTSSWTSATFSPDFSTAGMAYYTPPGSQAGASPAPSGCTSSSDDFRYPLKPAAVTIPVQPPMIYEPPPYPPNGYSSAQLPQIFSTTGTSGYHDTSQTDVGTASQFASYATTAIQVVRPTESVH